MLEDNEQKENLIINDEKGKDAKVAKSNKSDESSVSSKSSKSSQSSQNSQAKKSEKRVGDEVIFAITFIGRIIVTIYSFHGLFFIYNLY